MNATAAHVKRTSRNHLMVADFCEELDISRKTFYEWRAKRTAPRCVKLPNGELRVRRCDFEDWMDSRQEAA